MRRKLISLDAFDRIESDSLSRAEFELSEASSLLAQTLGTGPLSFGFFDDDKVVYETDNGTFVHAKYTLNESSVTCCTQTIDPTGTAGLKLLSTASTL
jgi:hypothetical protein